MQYIIRTPFLKPNIRFEDGVLIVGNERYLYTDMTSIRIDYEPSVLANGIASCVVNGQRIKLVYSGFSADDMRRAVEEVNNLLLEAPERDEKIHTVEGLCQDCMAKGYADGLFTKWLLRDLQVAFAHLEESELLKGAFAGRYIKEGCNYTGSFAYILTDQRILVGQYKRNQKIFDQIAWQDIDTITYYDEDFLGVIEIKLKLEIPVRKIILEHNKLREICMELNEIQKEFR